MKCDDLKGIDPFIRTVKIKKSSQLTGSWEDFDHLFIYIARGSCVYYYGKDQSCEMKAGDFILFPPYVPHSLRRDNSSMVQYIIHFDFFKDPARVPLRHQSALYMEEDQRPPVPLRETLFGNAVHYASFPVERIYTVERLFLELYQEFTEKKEGSELMQKALLCQLLCEALRADRKKEKPSAEVSEFQRSSGKLVDSVKDYIYLHYNENLSNERLSNIAHVSPNYLSRLFQKHTGMPLHNFLISVRLEKARNLLLSGDCNVTEAAERCGFSSVHSFSKTFKRELGVSPHTYLSMTSKPADKNLPNDYDPDRHLFYNE